MFGLGGGAWESPVCPGFPLLVSGRASSGGWSGRGFGWSAGLGEQCLPGLFPWPVAGEVQDDPPGRAAIRAGMVISWARIVPVVAFAWKAGRKAAAARVRLNAIAAHDQPGTVRGERPRRQMSDRTLFQVGDDLLDDGMRRGDSASAWTIGGGVS